MPLVRHPVAGAAPPDRGRAAGGHDAGLRRRGPPPGPRRHPGPAGRGGLAVKAVVGLVLAFALGFACRAFGIPSPAPPVVVGALLVMAMTVGYVLVDRHVAAHPARHEADCG